MLSRAAASASAMAGTAVSRIVVSSDSKKKPTATSHGSNRFAESPGAGDAAWHTWYRFGGEGDEAFDGLFHGSVIFV